MTIPNGPVADDPKYARPKQNPKNETVKLQSEITTEIERDAPHIARMVFGDTKDHPDVVAVSNQQLDALYRQKYIANDRNWLQAEARRDPLQFLKVADRIGVKMPAEVPGSAAPPPPGAFAKAATAPPPAMPPASAMAPSMPPVAAPVPVPPVPVLPSSPPVLLGPNGQPLPPSGLA